MLLPLISMASPKAVMVRRLRSFRLSRSGSAAVEFAMVGPIFFALIFAIIETGMVFFAGQMLETAVQDGGRLLYTSQSFSQTDFKSAICARVTVLMDCTKLDVDVRSYPEGTAITITNPIDSNGNYIGTNFVYQPTAYPSTNTVVVRAFYQWPLFVTQLGYNIANIGRNTSNSARLLAATTAVGPQ